MNNERSAMALAREAEGISHVTGLKTIHYVNVYRDEHNKLRYSPEEFGVDQEGIFSFDDALDEAFTYCVRGTWTLSERNPLWQYVCTLSNDTKDVSAKLDARLGDLKGTLQELEAQGKDYSGYNSHDIEGL